MDYLFSKDMCLIEVEMAQESSSAPSQGPSEFQSLQQPTKGTYSLEGAIIHLGSSIQCGHYVSYVRRDDQWLYLNDNRVAVVDRPQLEKATLLLFRQT